MKPYLACAVICLFVSSCADMNIPFSLRVTDDRGTLGYSSKGGVTVDIEGGSGRYSADPDGIVIDIDRRSGK